MSAIGSAITTATSGLEAGVAQLTASASNVANAESSGPLGGAGFGPATVVGSAGGQGFQAYQPVRAIQSSAPGGGVQTGTVPVQPASTPAYDPTSPFADANGLVAQPNVDLNQEMVGQMGALAFFKSNLAVLKTADEMQKSLLAIA